MENQIETNDDFGYNAESLAFHQLPKDFRRYIGFSELIIDTLEEREILKAEVKKYGIGRMGKYLANTKALLRQCAEVVIGYGCEPVDELQAFVATLDDAT